MTKNRPRQPRIADSLADASREVQRAATDTHHLNIGSGKALTDTWLDAGVELTDLPAMRQY